MAGNRRMTSEFFMTLSRQLLQVTSLKIGDQNALPKHGKMAVRSIKEGMQDLLYFFFGRGVRKMTGNL